MLAIKEEITYKPHPVQGNMKKRKANNERMLVFQGKKIKLDTEELTSSTAATGTDYRLMYGTVQEIDNYVKNNNLIPAPNSG